METRRLRFRKWTKEDAEALYELTSEPSIGKGCGWSPHESPEKSRIIIEKLLQKEECYALVLKEENRICGCIELMRPKHTGTPSKEGELELGLWMGVPFQRRGLMQEAAERMLEHGFQDLKLNSVSAGYFDWNHASANLQKKLGFHYAGEAVHQDLQTGMSAKTIINRLTRNDWESRNSENQSDMDISV